MISIPLVPLNIGTHAIHLLLTLGAVAGPALAGSSKPSMPLNDTGMTQCVVNDQFTTECTGTGQDGELGRDVSTNKPKDGLAGFSYQKICNNGEAAGTGSCPSDPKLGSKTNQWACTQDKVTGLIWEVKSAKSGNLRDWQKTYTNYGDGRQGDASEFVAQVNAQGLCGAKDWVLPTAQQLQSLMNFGVTYPGPTLDTAWFPYTQGGNDNPVYAWYWAQEPYLPNNSQAWGAFFLNATVGGFDKTAPSGAVRLVRKATAPGAKRFVVNSAGDEVTDKATGLIWRRCVEGMVWNGTNCFGNVYATNWYSLLDEAKGQAQQSGKPWRMPNVNELASLVDRTRSPAIDPTAFPNRPNGNSSGSMPYVSSTPTASVPYDSLGVEFMSGSVVYRDIGWGGILHLVRNAQ